MRGRPRKRKKEQGREKKREEEILKESMREEGRGDTDAGTEFKIVGENRETDGGREWNREGWGTDTEY